MCGVTHHDKSRGCNTRLEAVLFSKTKVVDVMQDIFWNVIRCVATVTDLVMMTRSMIVKLSPGNSSPVALGENRT